MTKSIYWCADARERTVHRLRMLTTTGLINTGGREWRGCGWGGQRRVDWCWRGRESNHTSTFTFSSLPDIWTNHERERKWIHRSKPPVVFVPILTNHCRWVDLSIEKPNHICKWDRGKNRTKYQTGEEFEDVPWTAIRQIDGHETRSDRRWIDPWSLFLLVDFGEFGSSTSRAIPTDDFGSKKTMWSRIRRAHLSFSTWCIRGERANRSTQIN